MKKIKFENLIAVLALLGILWLFGAFLFDGATVFLTVIAVAITIGSVLAAFFSCRIQQKGSSTLSLRAVVCSVLCLILGCSMVMRAEAAFEFTTTNVATLLTVSASSSDPTNSNSTVSVSGGVITVKANGITTTDGCGGDSHSTDTITLTITNNNAAEVQYDLSLTNATGATGGTGLTLESGGSLTITVTSGSGSGSNTVTGTITFSNVTTVSTGVEMPTLFGNKTSGEFGVAYSATFGGTYTVDNVQITENQTLTNASNHPYALVATPANGYTFYGWMSKCFGLLSTSLSHTYTATEGSEDVVWPLFIKNGSALYYIKDVTPVVYYGFIDDAIAAAGTSGTIVLSQSGTMYGTSGSSFSLTGQTLLIPYSANDTSIATETETVEGGWNSTLEYANTTLISDFTHDSVNVPGNILLPNVGVTYTLTIPAGTVLNVGSGGKFVVGGTIASGHVNTAGICGGTSGAHSNIQLEGTINVNSGGILSSCGYVLGGGQVNVSDGGTVYQPFVLMDHRDGHYAVISHNDDYFPFNRYSMMNIQADIHMTYGAIMKGYVDLYTQHTSAAGGLVNVKERHNVTCAPIIGVSNSLILLNTEDSALDISYDGSRYADDKDHNGTGLYNRVGTTTLNFSGGATLGKMSLKINVAGSDYNLDTSKNYFPVPYNYNINLSSGDYDIANMMKLLPGATMTVASDATLTVSSMLAVMDGFRDHSLRGQSSDNTNWHAYHYPSTSVLQASPFNSNGTANLIIDGVMTVTGTFGGLVQTNGSGTVTMSGTNSLQLGVGAPNASKIMMIMDTAVTGKTVRTLTAQLMTVDGRRITMENGKTYYAVSGNTNTIANYTYTLYTTYNDDSKTSTLTQTLNANVIGTWCTSPNHAYEETVTVPTCTAQGYTTHTCAGCGHTYKDTYTDIDASNHVNVVIDAAVAPTCTETGLTEGSHCSVCNVVLVAQETVAATGHSYSSVVTAPTCTEDGYTTHTCSGCGDSYVDSSVDALGHDYQNDDPICDRCDLFEFLGTNVFLGNSLDMWFAFPKAAIEDIPTGYSVTITQNGTDGKEIPYSEEAWQIQSINGVDCYIVIYDGVAAKEMCDLIEVTVYDETGKAVSVTKQDSIRAYVHRLLAKYDGTNENYSPNEALCKLLVDMLNYGAACQNYFAAKENTRVAPEDLANALLSDVQKGFATTGDFAWSESDKLYELNTTYLVGANLVTESKIQFAIKFNTDVFTEGMYFTYSFADHWNDDETEKLMEGTVKYDGSDCYYIDDLVVADARQTITITLYNADGTQVVQWSDSVESYCKRMYDSTEGNEKAVFEAFMKFSDSAEAYLEGGNRVQ